MDTDQNASNLDKGWSLVKRLADGPQMNLSPDEIQRKIMEDIRESESMIQQAQDPSTKLTFVMFQMQKFSGVILQFDAMAQQNMDQYMKDTKEIWDDIKAGGQPPPREKGESDEAYAARVQKDFYPAVDEKLKIDANHLLDKVKDPGNKFFSKHKDLSSALQLSLYGILDVVYKIPNDDGETGLFALWKKYDPSLFITSYMGTHSGITFPSGDYVPEFNPRYDSDTHWWYFDINRIHQVLQFRDEIERIYNKLSPDAKAYLEKETGGWKPTFPAFPEDGDIDIMTGEEYDQAKAARKEYIAIRNKLADVLGKPFPGKVDGSPPGEATEMNMVMRDLGQLNQQLTGASEIMQTTTKIHSQTYETQQNIFQGFMKLYEKIAKTMISKQKT